MGTRKYDGPTCERRRRECLDRHVLPLVGRTFRTFGRLRSAVFLVAQFWNDEADDAVHGVVVYSSEPRPDLDGWIARCREFRARSPAGRAQDPQLEDEESALDWLVEGYDLAIELGVSFGESHSWVSWDANHEAISLFAAFCREGAHQDDSVCDAFAPYAILVRDPAEQISIEVVGTMIRPWLDGVRPSWAKP